MRVVAETGRLYRSKGRKKQKKIALPRHREKVASSSHEAVSSMILVRQSYTFPSPLAV